MPVADEISKGCTVGLPGHSAHLPNRRRQRVEHGVTGLRQRPKQHLVTHPKDGVDPGSVQLLLACLLRGDEQDPEFFLQLFHTGGACGWRLTGVAKVGERQGQARGGSAVDDKRSQITTQCRGRIVDDDHGVGYLNIPVVLTVVIEGMESVTQNAIDPLHLNVRILVERLPKDNTGADAPRELPEQVLVKLGL
jgi:hypothetical protein